MNVNLEPESNDGIALDDLVRLVEAYEEKRFPMGEL